MPFSFYNLKRKFHWMMVKIVIKMFKNFFFLVSQVKIRKSESTLKIECSGLFLKNIIVSGVTWRAAKLKIGIKSNNFE